jgi:ubiquinone/menaquinone biosynthesis C-methylase UbiE
MNLYTSGKYLEKNPTYHIEDSQYKCENFLKILKNNNFNFLDIKNIIDVGCGAGGILKNLSGKNLFNSNFIGYDINSDAITIAKANKNSEIKFYNQDYFTSNYYKKSDLVICADVFEHVDDETNFLKKLLNGSKYFLFNIPLDISLLTLLRKNCFKHTYNNVGHIHFYSKYSVLLKLEYCGFKIIDTIYAKNRLEHFTKDNISLKRILVMMPQYVIDKVSEDLSCSIFGGYSLVVLSENPNFNQLK